MMTPTIQQRWYKQLGVVVLLLTTVGLILSSCGSEATPTIAATTTQAGAGNRTTQASGGKAKTVLTFWTQNRADETFMRQQIDLFNKTNPDNIEVDYTVRSDDYAQAIQLAWQSNQGPDLFTGNTLDIPGLAKKGLIEPLDGYLNAETKSVLGQAGYINDYNVINGKLYCLINVGTTYRLIYNQDLFKKAGLTDPPATISQMVDDAKKLTDAGNGIYGFAVNLKTPNNSWKRSLYSMAQRSGLYYYNYQTGQFDFNGYLPYLNAFSQMIKDGSMSPQSQALDIDTLRKQFAGGKIAMYLSISAEPSVYAGTIPTTINWAAAPQPTLDATPGGAAPLEPVYWMGISAQSKNKQADAEVLNWFSRKDFLAAYQEGGYGNSMLPAVSKVAKAPTLKNYSYFLPTQTDAVWPVIPAVNKVDGKDKDAVMIDIAYGVDSDPAAALSDLTNRYNKALNDGIAQGIYPKIVLPNFSYKALQGQNSGQ